MKFFTLGSTGTSSNNSCYSGAVLDPTVLKTRNRFKIGSLLVLMIFGLAMLMPSNMQAQSYPGFLDGDVLTATPVLEIDGENVYSDTGLPSCSITTGILFDDTSPDQIFTGGGTKDHLPINTSNPSKSWQWKDSDGSSSDKTDIMEGGAILIGDELYFFGNKFAFNGTTTIGFWFFQDLVDQIPGGRFSGEHTVDDILVVADIANGGAVGIIDAYRWVGDGNGTHPSSTKSLVKISTNVGDLTAIVNIVAQPTPWPHQSKAPAAANIMPPITFFEGFIDRGVIFPGKSFCFSSVLVETRSSNPVNSILEDFTAGSFDVQPTVSVADITKCEDDDLGMLTAVASGGIPPLTYVWTLPDLSEENTGAVNTYMPTVAGTYSVVVIGQAIGGGDGCPSSPDSADVTINPSPIVSDATDTFCDEDQTDKSLSDYDSQVGPGAGYTVAWFSDSARTVSETSTGGALAVGDTVFYATITNDTTGCDADAMLTITINATPVLSDATDTFCDEDQTDKSLSDYDSQVGPGVGYTVAWFSDSARTVSETSTGGALAVGDTVFYATITNDTTGCDADAMLTITINATPVVSDATDTFCDE